MNEPNEAPRTRTGAPLTVAQAAALVGGRVVGDESVRVVGVAPVDEAEPEELAFLALKRYARFAPDSAARAFLIGASLTDALPDGRAAIVVEEPYPALRTLLGHFYPETRPEPRVHPTAIVSDAVRLGADVHVGPYAVIEDGVVIGDGCTIGAHCVIGRDSRIGARSLLHPQVVLYHGSVLGADVVVHSGARIGPDGFGYTFVDGVHRKMPQVGRAVVEDDVEIGANSAIDRGSLGDTVVGRGVKIDNLVQVAHNVKVGALSLLAALSGVAGSTRLGRNVWLGGRAGVINQLDVGDDARIAVGSLVMRDVPSGETVSGMPARPHREEMRKQAQLARLYRLVERVDRLEKDVRRLEGEP